MTQIWLSQNTHDNYMYDLCYQREGHRVCVAGSLHVDNVSEMLELGYNDAEKRKEITLEIKIRD